MLADGFYDVPAGKIAAVVTHLEMHAPAKLADHPCPEGVEMRALTDLSAAQYRQIYRRVGDDWLWFSRTVISDEALENIIQDPDVLLFTLMFQGQAEALLELDFRVPEQCELAFFGVSAPLLGQGAGRFLMKHAIEQAWARPIKRFHVHTCTVDSAQALPFYLRSGFRAYKRQVEIADDPRVANGWDQNLAAHMPIIS